MRAFYIGTQNLLNKRLNTLLSLILMGFGVALISLLINVNYQIKDQFQKNLAGVDLVVGAKGSPLQIILCNIFHIDYPTGNIKEKDILWLMNNRLIKESYPISLGDSYKDFRIVGCTESYTTLYNAHIDKGAIFKENFEVVLGANVANSTGLGIGDTFHSTHGIDDNDMMGHEEVSLKVSGILIPSGTVIDHLILTKNESVRKLHHSDDSTDNEITSLLLKFRNPLAAIQLPRKINAMTNLQAASPSFEAARLFALMGKSFDVMKYIGVGIMSMAGLSIFISLFIALKERKYELALLRSLGASRLYTLVVVLSEAWILSVLGYILGIFLCHAGLFGYEIFGDAYSAYQLDWVFWVKEEFYLFIYAWLIATLASLLPAFKAYFTDISETLSNAKN